MVAPSQYERYQWMKALRQGESMHLMGRVCVHCNNQSTNIFLTVVQHKGLYMSPLYHPGLYHKRWTCCDEASPEKEGCTETGILSTAYEGIIYDGFYSVM